MSLVLKLILILVLSGKIINASEFQASHLYKAAYCAELVRFTDRSGPLLQLRINKREDDLQSENIKKNARDIISLGTFLDFAALGIEDARRKLLELELGSHNINSDMLIVQRHWTTPLEFTISPEIKTELESCSAELSELTQLFNCSRNNCGPSRDFTEINKVLIQLNLEPIENINLDDENYSLIDKLTFKAAKIWNDFIKLF